MILPRVRDENRHFGVLMENLLYTTIVGTPTEKPMTTLLGIVSSVILFIAEFILAGEEVGRILAGRATGRRRRSRLAVIIQS